MKLEVEGGLEIERALGQLADQPAMRRAVRKALREAAKPMLDAAIAAVPVDKGDLRKSIKMGTARKARGEDPDTFGIVLGIDADVQPARQVIRKTRSGKSSTYRDPGVAGVGPMIEFGTPQAPAEPFMRPAWDAHGESIVSRFGEAIGPVIESEAARLAKKNG